ncbi:Ppx/GppA phosphatase family protein [Asticcacaulis sp. ZE23SCel15]|uniref:Ppx/GppA family phosphatase n=1 Tax=Asticcacaulis sp. ZE23SCel15 TaxID=3059027 RepID=UPI00265F9F5B|nr:Ppx/GppA phosphatase family protein [Asticcacaulis sp. ZE23SCel15]WKL56389.1 Ppx/GppA phosphatase family protein [Asticcacaulis sp. ZE23SCel15]
MLVPENNHNTAVIDIGSNSVRLVIYRIEGRSIWPLFNEKILAGLGRDLRQTECLHPQGKKDTLIALRRFKAILESYTLSKVHVVATAALRDAADGPEFAHEIERVTGFKVRTLTGREEAHYAGQGVRCGQLEAEGFVGDLGGSSLELINLDPQSTFKGLTLPLGPFALGAPKPMDVEKTYALIRAQLDPLRSQFRAKTFHAVGGAWRNLALIWMMKVNYPLQIVQQFELSARDALTIARLVAIQSPTSLEKFPGVSKRRMENISYAALVLQGLIECFEIETICFSANGLREGLLFDDLPEAYKNLDPLIEGCANFGARHGISENLGPALAAWATEFYDSVDVDRPSEKLIKAAAKLSDIGARLHPDHRADLVCDQVLRAPIPGQNHAERVFLACALYTRYSGDAYTKEPVLVSRILGDERHLQATQLGLTLRLGCDLSAKSDKLLKMAHIRQDDKTLIVSAKAGWDDLLLGEQTRKRARALASALKLSLRTESY